MDDRLRAVEIELGVVKQRVEDHEGDIHTFAALPTELEKLRWVQEQQGKSLDAAHATARDLAAEIEHERTQRIEDRADYDKARKARDLELAEDRDTRDTQAREMRSRIMVATIGFLGVFVTSLFALLAAYIQKGGLK